MNKKNLYGQDTQDNGSLFRILSLDGGGAKGFYTLGVLKEIEEMFGSPLYKWFDLIFGTSTGAVIAALIGIGFEIDQIYALYKRYIPKIMRAPTPSQRSATFARLADEVFMGKTFEDVLTDIGIVAARWITERPVIFSSNITNAKGRMGKFSPSFGVNISNAVQASSSAYPFFDRKNVITETGEHIELIDGGYCANNPTMYAIADATAALGLERSRLRVLNVGVGGYPEPEPQGLKMRIAMKYILSIQLLHKTLEINTQSMEQLRSVLFKDVPTIRVSDTFLKPEMAIGFMERNMDKLNALYLHGRESFVLREDDIKTLLLSSDKPRFTIYK